jgi:hypothetical protein
MQYVAFSGGKDSTALALLMPDATPVFTDTGWEFDELYRHIEKFEAVTGREVARVRPAETLPEYIQRSKFMPGHGARYCTRLKKIEPMNAFLAEHLPAELCIGLRADEPEDMRVGNLTDMDGLTIRYPFREQGLNLWDILRICTEHDLLPRYPVYMARGGCKGCFYKRKSEVKAMAQLVPEVMDELQALEESVQDERGRFALMFPNAGMSIRDIRSQSTLFDMKQVYADAADVSDKGAACGLFCHR